MIMMVDDFHPTESAFAVFGELETNVFRFVHRKMVTVVFMQNDVRAHESIIMAETVVGIIGQKREVVIDDFAQ